MEINSKPTHANWQSSTVTVFAALSEGLPFLLFLVVFLFL